MSGTESDIWRALTKPVTPDIDTLVERVRRGIPKEGRDALKRWAPSTPSVRSVRQASAALTELAERVKAAEASAKEWEDRYEELLSAVGGVWPS